MLILKSKIDSKKGFTLVEIAVTAVIVGILAMIAIPNLNKMSNRASAQDIFQNLKAIYTAQQAYAQEHNGGSNYCDDAPACATDFRTINTNLNLNIIPNGSSYSCSKVGSDFICTSSPASNAFTMEVDLSLPISSKAPLYCQSNHPTNAYNPCCDRTGGGGGVAGQPCP